MTNKNKIQFEDIDAEIFDLISKLNIILKDQDINTVGGKIIKKTLRIVLTNLNIAHKEIQEII